MLSADTVICKGDTILLKTMHDGLNIAWSPTGVDSTNLFEANVHPVSSAWYVATASVGSCFEKDSAFIKVVPLPAVVITKDTLVCTGAPVYLHATGGSFYVWTPAAQLSDANIADPVLHPLHSGIYSVSVTDTLGCPKAVTKSVTVSTYRGLFAAAKPDTLVVIGEPVQLSGTGGQYYEWAPPQYLSDPFSATPVARPLSDTWFVLKISNDNGCVDFDSVHVRVFKDPDIYVPTAFTPNGDGKNDLFKVYPVSFDITNFSIYDRWGNIVFSTSDYTRGWDGTFRQRVISAGTFVWIVQGKNKKTGATVVKKGTITLVR
jgi:gliding motility-associated-like protein